MHKKQFYIKINGNSIAVTEEIYLSYYRSKRRDRYYEYDIKTETPIRDKDGGIIGYSPSKEDSFDRLIATGKNFIAEQKSVEDAVTCADMADGLHKALDTLSEHERELIYALFFSNDGIGMTERECAEKFGISKTALHARKTKVFALLKNLLEK